MEKWVKDTNRHFRGCVFMSEVSQKPTRRCSPLLAQWKKPIQATMIQHFTPTRSADVCSLGLGAVSPRALGGGGGRGWDLPLPQFGRLISDSCLQDELLGQ